MKKYTISNKKCRECGGLISWDDYPSTQYPIIVDKMGNKIEMGSCPRYDMPPIQNEISQKPVASYKPTLKPATRKKSFKNYIYMIFFKNFVRDNKVVR